MLGCRPRDGRIPAGLDLGRVDRWIEHEHSPVIQGCRKPGVEPVFQPAGEGDFLVALLGVCRGGRNWKVPSTRRLESPRYVAEFDAALRGALPAFRLSPGLANIAAG